MDKLNPTMFVVDGDLEPMSKSAPDRPPLSSEKVNVSVELVVSEGRGELPPVT